MFKSDSSIAANLKATASETFGAETVIIHFERGTYFSLRGSASTVWSLLQQPTSVTAILEAAEAETGAAGNLESKLVALVTELAEHDLVTGSPDSPSRPALAQETLLSLAAPADLEVFADLTELIAMDPVHEIDSLSGWPNAPSLRSQR